MFDRNNASFRHTNGADVRLRLAGDEPFSGVVYLTIGQRLSDLLNDDRAFIPVRRENGETIIIAKTQILSVSENAAMCDDRDLAQEKDPAQTHPSRSFDPYATLRVSPDASRDEIRAAYKSRMKSVHPDAIAALDLDEDLSKAALLVAQKVNYAYQKIMREREDAKAEQSAAAV